MQLGGREATRGTVFTTNDEEHNVVPRSPGICILLFTNMCITQSYKEAVIQNRLLGRLDECLWCLCGYFQLHVGGGDVIIYTSVTD